MNRKAVDIEFNWIFILIAGVVILTFFIGIASWWNKEQGGKIAAEALDGMSGILTGAASSSDTVTPIELKHTEIIFSCDPKTCVEEGCASSFSFSGTDVVEDTDLDIIFSQNVIDSDVFYGRTMDFEMPFKVANLLYLITPNVKHYLVYDTGSKKTAEIIQKELGKAKMANAELVEKSVVKDKQYNNEYLVKFIMFFEPSETIAVSDSIRDSKRWDVMFVDGDARSGIVYFSKQEGKNRVSDERKSYPYLSTSSLIGAIYAEDYDAYKCNMMKALYRLRTVNRLLLRRTQDLGMYYKGDQVCEFSYDDAEAYFKEIDGQLSDESIDKLGRSQVQAIMRAAESINLTSVDAHRNDCPRLY
jgi:hypothetical protein